MSISRRYAVSYIHEDCWSHIMLYSDKQDLGRIACVSKTARKNADKSETWFVLCKTLWSNKQNHPLERWVTLPCQTQHRNGGSNSSPHELARIESTLVELEASKRIIMEEMQLGQQYELQNVNYASTEDSKFTKRFLELKDYKERLEARIIIWQDKRQKAIEIKNNSDSNSSTQTVMQWRQACPLSRAVRGQWIRETEFDYSHLLDQIECVKKELYAANEESSDSEHEDDEDADEYEDDDEHSLTEVTDNNGSSGSRSPSTTPEGDSEEDCLQQTSSSSSQVRPRNSNWASQQQYKNKRRKTSINSSRKRHMSCKDHRIELLEEQLSELKQKAEPLQQRIVANLARAVDLKTEQKKYEKEGRLLSWKESFYASIVDSKRMVCTPEELRELGDMIILFGNVLEKFRFVRGGLAFFDNRSFVTRFGWFEIHGGEFYVPQVGGTGTVRRVSSDWGWEFPCVQGMIRMATYDRKKGLALHEGALCKNLAGNRWNPPEVAHEMMLSDPAFGLYSTETF